MDRTRRIALFSAALILSATTLVLIGVSIESIRDSVQFGRVMRRIERGDTATETLLEAARFARSLQDWQTVMRTAWNLDAPRRWEAVFALASPAMDRFPHDDRWRYAGALAALRRGDRSAARGLLPIEQNAPADDLKQYLRLLADIEPDNEENSRQRLRAYRDIAPEYTVLRAVAAAEIDPTISALRAAWERTSVGAYGVNAALEAAAIGNREITEELVNLVRGADSTPSAEHESAPLYLALWLRDVDWLFEQLRALSGSRAVEPDILLVHADGMIQQGQLREARRFYRELQQVAPDHHAISYLNDAAITYRLGDGDPETILRAGLRAHRDSAELRAELAGVLIAREERVAAAQILGPSLVVPSAGEPRHRDWLLTRAVLGPRRPLSRLESDLWQYLNRHPEAEVVAQYLARFLVTRGDEVGADRLRGRYAPDHSEWTTTLHLWRAAERQQLARAEELVGLLPDDSWTAHFNRTLFTLRHLPLTDVSEAIGRYEEWLDRGPELLPEEHARAELYALLLRVEYERLAGRTESALEQLQRALPLAPETLDLSSYRRLVAPPQ
jgi:tetratricopeptide (TPR) repeat protein